MAGPAVVELQVVPAVVEQVLHSALLAHFRAALFVAAVAWVARGVAPEAAPLEVVALVPVPDAAEAELVVDLFLVGQLGVARPALVLFVLPLVRED